MSDELEATSNPCQAMIYQIKIKGHLGAEWVDWFEGLTITLGEDGDTLLTGPVVDQAGLHGLLKKVRDLGMPLLSVNCVEPGRAEDNLPQVPSQREVSAAQTSSYQRRKEAS